jgi:XapX domain-containing protein
MKPYLLALGAGALVGVIYGLLQVRSPAPPLVALVGLLGILLGEQVIPLGRRILDDRSISLGLLREECGEHILGRLPGRSTAAPTAGAPPRS